MTHDALAVIAAHEVHEEIEAWQRAREQPISTGFLDLDRYTGGFGVGQVWVITSRPGHGRSTLALTLALHIAADSRWPTDFVSARDRVDVVSARLLASTSKVPIHRLRDAALSDAQRTRIDAAVRRLRDVPLSIESTRHSQIAELAAGVSRAVVIDDFLLTGYQSLSSLRECADRGHLVIITVARHHVMIGDALEPTLAELADVIIDVERPDASSVNFSERPGEADLRLERNRLGPQGTISASFQGHLGRFIPLTIGAAT